MPRSRQNSSTGGAAGVAEQVASASDRHSRESVNPGDSLGWSEAPRAAHTDTVEGRANSPSDEIAWLRERLAAGVPWPEAMLETMGRWTLAEETHNNRRYKYMIGREAFDWLLLAERLCDEVGDLIPLEGMEQLLFHGVLPIPIEDEEFRELLGVAKYRAYLNFHYGVVLEEALQLSAEETVRKRHLARGFSDSEDLVEEAFRHLYTRTRTELLEEFREEARQGKRQGLTLTDLKEFTYWLHKLRVNYWDPARVASDTRLAIRRLEALREGAAPVSR